MQINKSLHKIKNIIIKLATIIRERNTPSCWSLITLLCLIPLIVTALFLSFHTSPDFCHIFIEAETGPLHIVNEKFISLGLDSSVITEGFINFNMTDPKLIKMIKYLSPAYLRIGGTEADQLLFCEVYCNEIKSENLSLRGGNGILNDTNIFTLLGSDWLKLHHLATSAKIDVIYDLNSLQRYEDGSWDSRNAEEMIQFSENNGLKLDWELGNEPNIYRHKFNTSINFTQLGLDYRLLRKILNRYYLYKNSYLVGPSTTRLRSKKIEKNFTEFLISGSQAVSAITWHHYYFSGMNATPSEFLDPNVFNYLRDCIKTANTIVRDLLKLKQPMWLGETASAWHAGAPNLSDRFIAGFIWIDKLGLSAQMGIDVVVRQSIFKGYYALLNDSYDPNPDWWLSILYNKLVGTSVIGTSYIGDHSEKIRLYAHCAKNSSVWHRDERASHSSVVVFGVNLQNEPGLVNIENLKSDPKVYVYEVTAGSSLISHNVRLNGKILNLRQNLELPDLKPKIIVRKKVLTMPAYSIVFWVFTKTNVIACKK